MNHKIYNKSSEEMTELEENSVNLIVAGPPYNIGTVYGNNKDLLDFDNYKKVLTNIFSECYRVLDNDGVMLVESADSILSNGEYIQLAGLIQNICLESGFNLKSRDINFVHTDNGIELKEDNRWQDDYKTKNNAHSNCHQWMIFTKEKTNFENGNIYYLDYKETDNHPCPFPQENCELFLDKYYKNGMTVLDPFMGTATLGENVLKKGGKYIGYEIDEQIFNIAKNRLQNIC